MKRIQVIFYILTFLVLRNLYCQEVKTKDKMSSNAFEREAPSINNSYPKDTIKIFLNDTLYYDKIDFGQLIYKFRNQIEIYKYFTSSVGLQIQLRDSLPDGFYCLYNLSCKKAKKTNDLEAYLIVSGEFKNNIKQGAFRFNYISENPKWTRASKVIYFKDDVVHGAVIERENDRIMFLGEYKMGVKHGFFYYYNGGAPTIILYEDGEIIKSSEFW